MSHGQTFSVQLTEKAGGVRILALHDGHQIADGIASDWATAFDQCIAALHRGKRLGEERLLQMKQAQSSNPAN